MLGLSGHAVGQTVYLDTFDNDGLDVNTNVGEGATAVDFNGAGGTDWGWDDLVETPTDFLGAYAGIAASGNRISIFNSDKSFNIDLGFTLEVQFDMAGNGTSPFGSNHLSLGLTAVSGVATSDSNLMQSIPFAATYDAIGFSLGTRNGNVDMGLLEWDADGAGPGSGTTTTVSPFSFTGGVSTQTVTLTVASDGSYSYSYDDGTGGGLIMGIGTTAIDMSQTYYFKVRTQGSSGNAIQSVSLMTASVQEIAAPTITSTADLIESGDSVDLNITFDTDSDTASLTTSSGSVDLIALDAGDAVPGDGMVLVTESPTSTYTYVVEASETAGTPKTASVEVLVADPSTEPADNAFSTAIKADSPLFYYRFEEAVDTGFLLDSSGNGNHTDGLLGAITQGGSPGGMQLAGRSDLSGAISVPASSEMSDSFTLTAVMNVDSITGGALRNLFAMANGSGTGRSILYYGNGGFSTFVDGGVVSVADADAVPAEMSCLVHFVYDADPDVDPMTDDQEIRFYVNGQLYGAPTPVNPVGLNLGEWVLCSNKNLGSQSLVGTLDETAVFEAALSDVQIAAHGTAFFAAADPLLGFVADSTEITTGDSLVLTWKTSDQASVVKLDGVIVDGGASGGVYTMTVSPTADTTYTIDVDGETLEIMVEVYEFRIVSISADSSTPPEITLTVEGAPSSSYDIKASADLTDGFPFDAGTVSTDPNGDGSVTLTGVGTAEFYRLETP